MNGGYTSTACRVGDHRTCQDRPVVECVCDCHRIADVRRELDSIGKWRSLSPLSAVEQDRYDLLVGRERFLLSRLAEAGPGRDGARSVPAPTAGPS